MSKKVNDFFPNYVHKRKYGSGKLRVKNGKKKEKKSGDEGKKD